MSKKVLALKIIGLSFLIPVILYWGSMIKEFVPNTPYAMEIAKEQGNPYWLIYLKWALFPWGLLISGILIPIAIGIIQLKNFWRRVTVVIMCLYIPFVLIMPFLIQHWFFQGTLIYAIFLIIFLTRKSVKNEFK
jgi:hypothetical protein